MKRITCLFFVLLSVMIISGCDGWCEKDDWTPPDFRNIDFSPKKVKRGDEITITYDISSSKKEVIEALFVDEDGNLLISEDFKNSRPEGELWWFEENYNDFVRFNTKVDETKKYTKKENCYPAKYISSEFGKIVCVVPDNAVSGVLYLFYDMDTVGSYSGEKLIVVDDDGNEINE